MNCVSMPTAAAGNAMNMGEAAVANSDLVKSPFTLAAIGIKPLRFVGVSATVTPVWPSPRRTSSVDDAWMAEP